MRTAEPPTPESKAVRAYLHDLEADIFKYLAAKSLLVGEDSPDLVAVIFKTTDLVQHKFWAYFDPESFGLTGTAESEVLGQVIPGTYEQLDVLLGELLEATDPETSVIVLSDHGAGPWLPGGFGGIVKEYIQKSFHSDYSGNHRLNGMAAFSGPSFRFTEDALNAWGEDVTPTILHAFGLPSANDMGGRTLVETFTERTLGDESLATVVSYGPPPPLVEFETIEAKTDEEMLERLKTLGYVE